MLEFSCREAGAHCKGQVTATDNHDLENKVAEHLRTVHGAEPNETLMTYLVSTVRETEGGGAG